MLRLMRRLVAFRILVVPLLACAWSCAPAPARGPRASVDARAPGVRAAATPNPRVALYPTPHYRVDGAGAVVAESVCIDTGGLAEHRRVDALLEELALAAGLTLAERDCDFEVRFVAEGTLRLDPEAEAAWQRARPHPGRFVVRTRPGVEPRTLISAPSERAAIYALEAALRMRAEGVLVDWPSFDVRGVIEGYYGVPASHDERLATLRLMVELRQNSYLYGPKADRFARADWATPYPEDQALALGEEAAFARARGIDFIWGVSPGAGADPASSIRYSSDADFQRLTDKLERMRALGIDHFALLLDDTSATLTWPEDLAFFSSLAGANAYLLNRLQAYLLARDPAARLLTVTSAYTEELAGWVPFNQELGALLRQDIDVLWTGRTTYAATLDPDTLASINALLGREVTIWDNAPAWVGSIRRRSDDLPSAARGFFSNNVLAQNGHPIADFWRALGPIADYTWNPEAYDPDLSMPAWMALGH